ncbi:MAG: ribonuclease H family protein [Acidimicrobiales bacterium]
MSGSWWAKPSKINGSAISPSSRTRSENRPGAGQDGRIATKVYTDGACIGNPGPGGWAWAVPDGPYATGAAPRTTNQRMEITAALEAVTANEGPLEVVSDSTYVVNCFRDRWWEGWLARNWQNKARQPVANRDLWEPLIEAVRADPRRVRFTWVKGHSSDAMNDVVDRLAVEAARTQTARRGEGVPEWLGPADTARASRSRSAPVPGVPEGRLLVAAGLRPPGLGGYGPNQVADRVRVKLAEVLEAKHTLHPDLVVLTGMGLGAEQLAAEAALEVNVPYVAVLAFPGQEAPWPADVKDRFRHLIDKAHAEVLLQANEPTGKQAAAGALARRDAWMARNGAEAVVVWDGRDAAVGRVVRSLRDHLGEEEVWLLDPAE